MTITQRALKFAEPVAKSATTKILLSHAYYQGATDQMQLDIDKACEWLFSELGDTKLAYPRAEMDGEWVGCFVEDFIDKFLKAMEE